MSGIRDLRESIDQLTASMGGWDWPGFVSTLVATLAGAGVAAGVAWLILRRERSDRYRERMYGAMVALAPKINQWADLAISPPRNGVPEQRMVALIDVLSERVLIEAVANEEDRKSLELWQEFFTSIDTISDEKDPPNLQRRTSTFAHKLLEHLRDIVTGAKSGHVVREEIRASLREVEAFERGATAF
ncbi:hypothetical protein ITJ58_17795 [Curtobacterium flaccumfaciens]|uniref:hypothetical protein n=1 Tax=Curtobacterium flaccumfaciens TaxID=2035 RepID=UPI00188C67FF|nr:hypothetical protein [Curtobacterium flaccumfaciens]MBF4595619.1 hypothetical protein [Curtobacterium flaccumfaciens]